jgi:hypothetical protein
MLLCFPGADNRSRCERIADANAEDFLPVIQIFGVQQCRTGTRRHDRNQCIPKGKLRLVRQSNGRANRRIIYRHQGPRRQVFQCCLGFLARPLRLPRSMSIFREDATAPLD